MANSNLSPAEEAEFQGLQKQFANAPPPSPNLSPQEEAEFQSLHQQFGDKINPEGTGFLSSIGRDFDAYTAAPVRAAVGAAEKGGGLSDAWQAYQNQFGKNPDEAPTTEETAYQLPQALQAAVPKGLIDAAVKYAPGDAKLIALAMKYGIAPSSTQGLVNTATGIVEQPLSYLPAVGLIGKATGLLGEGSEAAAGAETIKPQMQPKLELESEPQAAPQKEWKIPAPGPAQTEAPSDISKIQEMVENAKKEGANLDLPQASVIQDGSQYVPDEKYPILPIQQQALSNKNSWLKFQTLKADPLNLWSEPLQDYEKLQKQDWASKLDDTLSANANRNPIDNPTEAGENALTTMTDKAKAVDKQLAPIFQAIKDQPVVPGQYSKGLVDKIKDAFPNFQFNEKEVPIPGLENDPDAGPTIQYSMGPYKQKTGMTPGLYNQIKSTFDEVANEPYSPSDLQKIRQTLRTSIDPTSKTSAPLMRLNSVLLDHLEDVVGQENPELAEKIRPTFNAYRQNQQNISDLESTLGSSLSDKAGLMDKIPPEKALNRLFANSNTTKVAKNALGDSFNGVASDFINQLKNQATDANGNFSSAKFSTGLRKYTPSLQEAFSDNPDTLSRIQSLADRMRVIPDAPPANPSGTANAENILGRAKEIGGQALEMIDKPVATGLKMGAKGIGGLLKRRSQTNEINGLLKGKE